MIDVTLIYYHTTAARSALVLTSKERGTAWQDDLSQEDPSQVQVRAHDRAHQTVVHPCTPPMHIWHKDGSVRSMDTSMVHQSLFQSHSDKKHEANISVQVHQVNSNCIVTTLQKLLQRKPARTLVFTPNEVGVEEYLRGSKRFRSNLAVHRSKYIYSLKRTWHKW